MNKPVVVLIDDEAIILLSMKKELQNRFGARLAFETALNAAEADELIAELEGRGVTVALVVCDWYMPDMNGDEYLISLHHRRPGIKAIIVTGQADAESIERATRDAGLLACLSKPWSRDELYAVVEAGTAGLGPQA
jgi:response regulator RpfG family c-di-GMP phosphodiesterase